MSDVRRYLVEYHSLIQECDIGDFGPEWREVVDSGDYDQLRAELAEEKEWHTWALKHRRVILCALSTPAGMTDDTGYYDRMRSALSEFTAALAAGKGEGEKHE